MKSKTKKAVVATVPAVIKKQAAVVKAPAVKKQAEVKATVAKVKTEFVTIVKTKYGYYRHWVRAIMVDAGIVEFRFIKDTDSYDGVLAVAKGEADKARKALAAYTKLNPATVRMWE